MEPYKLLRSMIHHPPSMYYLRAQAQARLFSSHCLHIQKPPRAKLPPRPHSLAAAAVKHPHEASRCQNLGLHSRPHRHLSSTAPHRAPDHPSSQPSALEIDQYHLLADNYINSLLSTLDDIQEANESVDVEYSAGVLTLTHPPQGTYVLNKQPPNKQIWLSSPVSGPKRYDYVANQDQKEGGDGNGEWVYLRDGSTLDELLLEEIGVSVRANEGKQE